MENPPQKIQLNYKNNNGKNKDIKDTDNKGKADDNIKDTSHTHLTQQ